MGGAHDRGGRAEGGGNELEIIGQEADDLCAHRLAQRPPPQVAGTCQASGDDDALRIQDGDDGGDGLAQGDGRLAIDALGDGVTGVGESLHLVGAGDIDSAGGLAVAPGDLGPGRDGLQMAGAPAGAGLGSRRAGGHVPHLPGQEVRAVMDVAVQDDRPADPRAHGDDENAAGTGTGTDPGLAGGVGVDVVIDMHEQILRRDACGEQASRHSPGDVGAGPAGDGVSGGDDHAPAGVNDTGRADPDRHRGESRTPRRGRTGVDEGRHQGGDDVEHGLSALARRGGSFSHRAEQPAVSGHEGSRDLRTPHIDADDRSGQLLVDNGGGRRRHLRSGPVRARSPRPCPSQRPAAP